MIKSYFMATFRSIKKYKGYSIISIVSFTIGIACFILAFMWIQDEINFDRFHEHADEIYRIVVKKDIAENSIHSVVTPNPLGPTLKNEFPEITNVTRVFANGFWVIQYGEKVFYNSDIIAYADSSFFDVFSFPFVKGNPKTALADPNSLVITESFARKYFGDEDPMNKIIKLTYEDLKITGVIRDIPNNSHLRFDAIMPLINTERYFEWDLGSWRGVSFFSAYIQVKKGTSQEELERKISGIVTKYDPESKIEICLQPLKEIHLKSKSERDTLNHNKGNIVYLYIIFTLALVILFIACFNYMNLSTARSIERSKGIALRKVVGATRIDIMEQFLSESIISSFIALIFALLLVYFLLPVFNDVSGKHLTLSLLGTIPFILGLIILAIVIGIISGSYPAFLLSSFQPVNIMKGLGNTAKKRGGSLRKILIFIQFAVAIILILTTIVIYTQLGFLRTKDLGFDSHNVITFMSGHQLEGNFEGKKALFLSNPNVLDFCMGDAPMFMFERETNDVNWEGKDPNESIVMYALRIDYGYFELYDLKMAEGRSFSKEFSTDTSSFIFNETAIKVMGLKSPLGKRFRINGREGMIIGVVKDYHHRSLHSKIMPLVLMLPYDGATVSARISQANVPETVRFFENTWNKINRSPYPFSYTFADDKIAALYKSEKKMGTIAQLSTFIALLISCMGLFGLSVYISRQRTKEIGIRRVNGATVSGIVWLISRDFLKLVLAALIIACPVGWYIMYRWLQNFAYRISIEWWMFILTGAIALVIAFLTVTYQVIKAARTNPVDILKYE